MRPILVAALLVIFSSSNAQTLTVEQTDVEIKKADMLYKEGKELLVEFVLTQDTSKHGHAFRNFKEAKVIYDNMMVNGQVKANDWGTTIASLVDAKLMMLKSYTSLYSNSFRDRIMAETAEERTKKVKYKDVEYKLSKASKVNFENLNL